MACKLIAKWNSSFFVIPPPTHTILKGNFSNLKIGKQSEFVLSMEHHNQMSLAQLRPSLFPSILNVHASFSKDPHLHTFHRLDVKTHTCFFKDT